MSPSNIKFDSEWEEEVYNFFGMFGFNMLGGGENFRIGKSQVDVCFSYEDTLFIVECKGKEKYSREDDESKLKRYLSDFISDKKEILRGVGENNTYAHFREDKIRFILATKDFIWKSKKYVKNRNEVTAYEKAKANDIWRLDDNFFFHYNKLFDYIGQFAIYQLLSEIRVKPRKIDTELEIPAFKSIINGYPVYTFWANPLYMIQFCSVARRWTGEQAYQRALDGSRLPDIYNYMLKKGKVIPTNITLGFYDISDDGKEKIILVKQEKLNEDIELVHIKFPSRYGCLWVIDGQHRLYSAAKRNAGDPGLKFCFTLIDGIETVKQREIFVDVNNEAKPVPSELLWDIAGDAEPSEEKGIISNTVKTLDKSCIAFKNKIKLPTKIGYKGTVSFKGFCNSIRDLKLAKSHIKVKIQQDNLELQNPYYEHSNKRDTYKNLSNLISVYFISLKEVFDKEVAMEDYTSFMLRDAGIYIYLSLLVKLIIAKNPKRLKEEDFKSLASTLLWHLKSNYPDRKSIKQKIKTSGYQNRNEEVIKLCKVLYECEYPGFDKFKAELSSGDVILASRVGVLERNMRYLINDVLSEFDNEWFLKDKFITNDLRSKARNAIKDEIRKNPKKYTPYKHWCGLNINQVFDIIDRLKDDIDLKEKLNEVFIVNGFVDFDNMSTALHILNYIRNPAPETHNRPTEASGNEFTQARAFLSVFDKIFESFYGEGYQKEIDKKEAEYFKS